MGKRKGEKKEGERERRKGEKRGGERGEREKQKITSSRIVSQSSPLFSPASLSHSYLLSNHRLFATDLGTPVNKGRLFQIEAMHLGGVPVHLSVVLLHKCLANQGWV